MNLSFTEYRSQVLKTMWTKFNRDYVCQQLGFSTWRVDNICANHWKLGVEVFDCVLAMERYLVDDLMMHPMKCEQCDKDMAEECYIHAICNDCRAKNLDELETKVNSRK